MFRHHHSPRHLDDALRPVFGLSVAQSIGALLASGAAFGTWQLFGRAPHAGYLLTEARVFATGSIAALVFFAAYALAGDRAEPFARQLWGYARRVHHYAPSPLVTSVLEDTNDRAAETRAPEKGQLQSAALPAFAHRVRPFRRRHRR
jgi:hypothetical protein